MFSMYYWLILAVVAALSLCLVLLLISGCSKQHDDETAVELLALEKGFARLVGGPMTMSTLTWFKGDCNKGVVERLQRRSEEILSANPWLGGRIVRRSGRLSLVFRPYDHLDPSLHVMRNPRTAKPLSKDVPYDELQSHLRNLIVKDGPRQVLWKVYIIPCCKKPTESFAVMCSMSHAIGDGHTFYRIHNMLLDPEEEVEALDPTRILSTEKQQEEIMGGRTGASMWQSSGFIANMVYGFDNALLTCKRKRRVVFLVDSDEMEAAKRRAISPNSPDGSFVSTNDVLTSWFLQKSRCKHGFMAVNLRGRLDGHSEALAGNYENVIFYELEDSATPGLVRQSIMPGTIEDDSSAPWLQRVVTRETPLPGFWAMASGSVAVATNWSTFAKPCALEGCQEEIHVPILNFGIAVPSTLAILIIFRSGPRGLAVLVAGTNDRIADLEKGAPFLTPESLEF
ncbi:expressed unknown protein [Seminavis robusta]|uniref:O-acyltransferase WSD1-like N-terminal domain-containing protein n=1 Tax=Seminavis robusta TaxID=568900 RepID=A0A9N8HBQ0_9STRA|nr:expressed unknown protein [Seminavis robusta]|eukprot:Sro190_g082000.1 n/a (454) ;mRNA; f:84966-86487